MDDGVVIRLSYLPEDDGPRVVRSYRETSNSRGPGQKGNVYFDAVGLIDCPDGCGFRVPASMRQGHHAPHWVDGVLVNCRGEMVL